MMDKDRRHPEKRPFPMPEPEFSPEILPCPGMPEYSVPDRDFPSVVPDRSELPGRPVSRDELDFIPQQDEF